MHYYVSLFRLQDCRLLLYTPQEMLIHDYFNGTDEDIKNLFENMFDSEGTFQEGQLDRQVWKVFIKKEHA